MAKAKSHAREAGASSSSARTDDDEDIGLLAAGGDYAEGEGEGDGGAGVPAHSAPRPADERQQQPAPRTPRTPNRVRFDLTPVIASFPAENGAAWSANGSAHRGGDDDDDDDGFDIDDAPENRDAARRLPLLTNIEAPAVALANSPWGGGGGGDDAHDWAEAERQRPKSGLQAAFMNMANSIIGAGIIGQPYAFRQAGLLTGAVLLVTLTFVVDWTICLIVVNSKLSGASSFQGTVEHCFGRPGLIAISLAQWVFAFGGMVAFGVIVGDSIPHVLNAIWPGLRDIPVLGLLADRRAVIVVFILGISYPLTLYRDIAKVGTSFRRGGASRAVWTVLGSFLFSVC